MLMNKLFSRLFLLLDIFFNQIFTDLLHFLGQGFPAFVLVPGANIMDAESCGLFNFYELDQSLRKYLLHHVGELDHVVNVLN